MKFIDFFMIKPLVDVKPVQCFSIWKGRLVDFLEEWKMKQTSVSERQVWGVVTSSQMRLSRLFATYKRNSRISIRLAYFVIRRQWLPR